MINAITDIVVRESGRYMADEIFKRNYTVSPWMTLTSRGTWPGAMGETISNLTYERSAPTTTSDDWESFSVTDGAIVEGGQCLPTVTKIAVGSTTRSFSLRRKALEGPDFCAEELRSPFAIAQQLNHISGILSEYTRLEWERIDRIEYYKNVKHKVVCDASATSSSTIASTYPASAATSILTDGYLDTWYMKLLRDGAGQSALARVNGAPTLTVICSSETADAIIKTNTNYRQDLRDGRPSDLLIGLGALTGWKNYVFIIDPYPRRFEYSGGTYSEVSPFVRANATKGVKYDINPSWETATYEESFFFDPMVYTQLVPQPITSPAANFTFDPIRYTGDWKVMNIKDRESNPDGNILYHRGILAASSMPQYPERGVAFVHRRCDIQLNPTTCSN